MKAGADRLKDIRPLGRFRGIRILTPAEFLVEYSTAP